MKKEIIEKISIYFETSSYYLSHMRLEKTHLCQLCSIEHAVEIAKYLNKQTR